MGPPTDSDQKTQAACIFAGPHAAGRASRGTVGPSVTSIDLFRPSSAPPDTLFRFLSTARGLSAWHADEVRGDLDSREFRLRWPTLSAELRLDVTRSEPGRLVALRAGDSVVTLSIEEGGVRLVHDGLSETDDLDGLRSSWGLALALLDHAATRHPGGERRVHWAFETLTLSPELAHYYFATKIGLEQWLGRVSADLGEVGAQVDLSLDPETRIRGTILAHEPGRDLAISWDALDSAVLVLRTLPAPHGARTLTLSLSTWDDEAHPREIALLDAALRRLRIQMQRRSEC